MASSEGGVTVPAGTDPFDPQGDMVALANSLKSRIVVPVANTTERTALAAAISWSPSSEEPLRVNRADAAVGLRDEISYDGTSWTAVARLRTPVRHTTYDAGFPTTEGSGGVIIRITIPSADYARVLEVHGTTHLRYSQNGRVDAYLYCDSTAVDQCRRTMTASTVSTYYEPFHMSGTFAVAAGSGCIVELRTARIDGTGVLYQPGSSLERMTVVAVPA